MALPAFDPEKHHIGLKEAGASDYSGFILAGAYGKSFKRDGSDELAGIHYGGGDGLVNQVGLSTWTMDDFTGGAFQQVWGKDARMFSASENLLPAQFDRSLRTVPPLQRRSSPGVTFPVPFTMAASGGYVFAFFGDRLYWLRMSDGLDGFALWGDVSGGVGPFGCAAFDRRTGYFIGGRSDTSQLEVINPVGPDQIFAFTFPVGVPGAARATGISCDGDRIVVAIGDVLWVVHHPDDNITPPAGADWTRIGRLPGRWWSSVYANGLLYILCSGTDRRAQVVAFDGVQILPQAELPFNFVGESICEYAGRIYVGGGGRDISDENRYAELYEITASSVRLVKTFAPEIRSGRYAAPTSIHSMVVHEGLLFFGETGKGLIAYDVTTDALYGAMRFDNSTGAQPGRRVVQLCSARERLWAWVYVQEGPNPHGLWSAALAGEAVGDAFSGVFVASDFCEQLDRLKRWKRLRLLTRGDSLQPTLEFSADGGQTYGAIALDRAEIVGVARLSTFDLSGLSPCQQIRFRITLPRGEDATSFAELVAFTAAFTLVDSANLHADGTEKLAWSLTIAGVETVELEDGTEDVQRLAELRAQLWDWAVAHTPLSFTDADGSVYDVQVDSLRENQPAVLPPVVFDEPLSAAVAPAREAFYTVTLVEAEPPLAGG